MNFGRIAPVTARLPNRGTKADAMASDQQPVLLIALMALVLTWAGGRRRRRSGVCQRRAR